MKETATNDSKVEDISKPKKTQRRRKKKNRRQTLIFFLIFCAACIPLGFLIREILKEPDNTVTEKPSVYIPELDDTQFFQPIKEVFEELGFVQAPNEYTWDVLWTAGNPFTQFAQQLRVMRPSQRVNRFPGMRSLRKHRLAMMESQYIPKGFRQITDDIKMLEHYKKTKYLTFIQRPEDGEDGIPKLFNLTKLDFQGEEWFAQDFLRNPLLVDGLKFDVTVYGVITSIDPLRLYLYRGDLFLRFCSVPFFPIVYEAREKYVCSRDFYPAWGVPSLENYFTNKSEFTIKDSFEGYLRDKGLNPKLIWDQFEDAVRSIFLQREEKLIKAMGISSHKENYFELLSFDFAISNDYKVSLLQINRSPEIFDPDLQILKGFVKRLMYNTLSLVGISSSLFRQKIEIEDPETLEMLVSQRHLQVNVDDCASSDECPCSLPKCRLCKACLNEDELYDLRRTYLEHVNRGDMRRIFPVPIGSPKGFNTKKVLQLSPKNQLLSRWFLGKCEIDDSWC